MALRALQPGNGEPSFNQDPFRKQALGSLALHAAIVGSLLLYAVIAAHIHGNSWGDRSDTQGAIQATMVASAPAIPLPQDQKPTDQVLATQTPSPAPAPPAPKAAAAQAQDSLAIAARQVVKLQPKKQVAQEKLVKVPIQHVPLVPAPLHPEQVHPTNRANYGEAAPAAIPRSMAQATPAPQVNVQGGNFGAMFPWYVNFIKQRTAQNWYKQEVDPSTPNGARVYLTFVIHRDGSPSEVRVQQSSNSPTLDSSCVRAVQRVDTYGSLPSGYTGSTLLVQYYCEQSGR
jgi:protein TonB